MGPQTSDTILPGLQREQAAGGQPVTVHTFGIGDGHCVQLLQAIAECMSGSYYYIKASDEIPQAYGDALGGLFSVVAKAVRVRVAPWPGVTVRGLNAGGVVDQEARTVVFNDL